MIKNFGLEQQDLFTFSCSQHLSYGTRITLLDKPQRHQDEWSAAAFVSPSQYERIVANKFPTSVTSFLVIRCEQSKQDKFSCTAVSTEQFDQSSEEIENDIIKILQRR